VAAGLVSAVGDYSQAIAGERGLEQSKSLESLPGQSFLLPLPLCFCLLRYADSPSSLLPRLRQGEALEGYQRNPLISKEGTCINTSLFSDCREHLGFLSRDSTLAVSNATALGQQGYGEVTVELVQEGS